MTVTPFPRGIIAAGMVKPRNDVSWLKEDYLSIPNDWPLCKFRIIAEESFEYDGPPALAVDSVSGADGGADGDVMTADDRASNNKTAKDFMERERSAEEKKKCEDVEQNALRAN